MKCRKRQFFKELKNSIFKILVFLHSATLTLQNSKFLPKLIKTLLDFYSNTSPRYFSSLLIFQFVDFVLDHLKPRVRVYFCVRLEKLTFLQKFSILLIGLSPICLLMIMLVPYGFLNMYLRHISSYSCIVHHIGLVHAC